MATEFNITYRGTLRCDAEHQACSHTLTTDAPITYGGRGETFSPTDLVAAAFGTCLMTVVGKLGEESGIDMEGARVHVKQEMGHNRIESISAVVRMPENLKVTDMVKGQLERRAAVCPVGESLHPDVKVDIRFLYPE